MTFFLLACTTVDTGGDGPVEETAADSGADTSVAPPPPELPRIAEADDLDPDPDVVHVALTAAPIGDGVAYNGQVPGPVIRTKRGDTVVVDFQNALDGPTTIHWHGLHVPAAMDGVTWVMEPVAAGAAFTYTFTVDQPGTFWYHPHIDTAAAVDRGLYGVLVVEDPAEPPVDEDIVIALDAVGEVDEVEEHGHTAPDPAALTWTANGALQPVLTLGANRRVRARVLNVANVAYLDLVWPGMRQIASDQGLLPVLREPASVVLAPGDRAEFEWLPTDDFAVESGRYTASGGTAPGDRLPLFTVDMPGPQAAPTATAWPFTGAAPSADPGRTDVIYVFSGGAEGEDWLINGEAFPDVTVQSVALGGSAVIEVRNLSATEHPFHLHGYRFEVLSVNGEPPATHTVEDTVNVPIRAALRLLLVADNPGDWMAHCHLLQHAEDGMMSVLRVE
jgi:FtsP/CotA-like multicopper oxidase with cupredoxin domain